MTLKFYGATIEAQESVNKILSLPATGKEQDWEFELADPKKIDSMLVALSSSTLSFDERCALSLLTIATIEESGAAGGLPAEVIDRARNLLQKEHLIRDAMTFYWIDQDRSSNKELTRYLLGERDRLDPER